jgi:hypothetical protein
MREPLLLAFEIKRKKYPNHDLCKCLRDRCVGRAAEAQICPRGHTRILYLEEARGIHDGASEGLDIPAVWH